MVRPCLQEGDAVRSLSNGERKRRGTGHRRSHVRGHRGKWSGEFSEADQGGTNHKHISAHAGTEEGDSEGRGKGPRSFDSDGDFITHLPPIALRMSSESCMSCAPSLAVSVRRFRGV